MTIMPQYTSLNTTPMTFHKFLKYAIWIIVIAIVVACYYHFNVFLRNIDYILRNVMFGSKAIQEALMIPFSIVAAVNIRNRKWLGIKALYVMLAVEIISDAIAMGYCIYAAGFIYDDEATIRFIVAFVVLILIKVYYDKRRLLFYPYYDNTDVTNSSMARNTVSISPREKKRLEEQLMEEMKALAGVILFPFKDATTVANLLAAYEDGGLDLIEFQMMGSMFFFDRYPNLADEWDDLMIRYHNRGLFPNWNIPQDNNYMDYEVDKVSDYGNYVDEDGNYESCIEDIKAIGNSDNDNALTDNVIADIGIQTDDEIGFCYKCGHKISPEAVFCEKCGTRVR